MGEEINKKLYETLNVLIESIDEQSGKISEINEKYMTLGKALDEEKANTDRIFYNPVKRFKECSEELVSKFQQIYKEIE